MNTTSSSQPVVSLTARLAVALAAAASTVAASAETVTVDGRSNIYTAGLSSMSAFTTAGVWDPGVVATSAVTVWGGATVSFNSVTNYAVRTGGYPMPGVEGVVTSDFGYPEVNISTPLTSLSGIRANRDGFFAGVFVSDGEPSGVPPAALDFREGSLGRNFSTLNPLLNQVFFIGDGKTDLGALQNFVAPEGATRLFLGSLDAWYTTTGCCWGDNYWDFSAQVSVVPAPGAIALIGLAGLAGRRRR